MPATDTLTIVFVERIANISRRFWVGAVHKCAKLVTFEIVYTLLSLTIYYFSTSVSIQLRVRPPSFGTRALPFPFTLPGFLFSMFFLTLS